MIALSLFRKQGFFRETTINVSTWSKKNRMWTLTNLSAKHHYKNLDLYWLQRKVWTEEDGYKSTKGNRKSSLLGWKEFDLAFAQEGPKEHLYQSWWGLLINSSVDLQMYWGSILNSHLYKSTGTLLVDEKAGIGAKFEAKQWEARTLNSLEKSIGRRMKRLYLNTVDISSR